MSKKYYEDQEKTVAVTRGGEEWTLPMPQWLAALDKVTTLAWVSSDYQAPTAFDWMDHSIYIAPAPGFPYPLTQDPDELLAHLHYYGIMTAYNADIPPRECASVPMDHVKLRRIEKNARAVGRPTFLQVFIENVGHIAPPLSRFRGLAGGMKYDPAKHRLTFRLVTFDQSALWQDFRMTWIEEGLAEIEVLRLDAAEKIPVWVEWDTVSLAEPTSTKATDNLDDLLPQAEWINANMTDRWGGRRPNAGRKKVSDQVSARVPLDVLDALKAAADADGVSLSAKTAEILGDWAKKGKGEG